MPHDNAALGRLIIRCGFLVNKHRCCHADPIPQGRDAQRPEFAVGLRLVDLARIVVLHPNIVMEDVPGPHAFLAGVLAGSGKRLKPAVRKAGG
jgi:hypothetical protein